jgi:4-amino-4-deoxy-L-arabinose transferase-like glycosyltransferase
MGVAGVRAMTESAPPPLSDIVRVRAVRIALVLAFMLRLGIALISAIPHQTSDSLSYINPGVNFFSHGTFAMTCDPRCVPTLMRTPVYPMLVGLLVEPFGLPLAAVYVFQALADTLTVLFVAAVGWGIGGRRAGIGSAFIHALNPFSAVFAAQVMSESVATLALMGGVYLIIHLYPRNGHASMAAWIALGFLFGFATLVRPVFAPIPGVFAVVMFSRTRWREQLRGWVVAAAGFAIVIGPWVARNWVVSRDGAADDSFRVLASSTVPRYRALTTPGLVRWYQSFEEPFIWDRLREVPAVARYLLPGEKERTEELFVGVRAVNLVISPELDAGFGHLADERIAAHPFRTRVLPPVSRAARLWITPRLSPFGIESARLSGLLGTLAFFASIALNGSLALFAFVTGFVLWRSAAARLVMVVPVYLTAVHAFIMWGNQSRYVVPAFPEIAILAALGGLALVNHVRRVRSLKPHNREASRAEVA